jgi:hypothetical protein
VPHDCKQDKFPSGTLESLSVLNRPSFWTSTNLKMNSAFLGMIAPFFF